MAVPQEKANVEVKLGVPVRRIWSAAKKIDVLMPLVLPDVFSSCDLDGDGGPGTIRVYHCGPGMPPPITRVRFRVCISFASRSEFLVSIVSDRLQYACDLDHLKAGSAGLLPL